MRTMIRTWTIGRPVTVREKSRKKKMNNPAEDIINYKNISCRVFYEK